MFTANGTPVIYPIDWMLKVKPPVGNLGQCNHYNTTLVLETPVKSLQNVKSEILIPTSHYLLMELVEDEFKMRSTSCQAEQ